MENGTPTPSVSSYFFKRLLAFLAFVLPIAYIGILLTVTIHEIFGHGLGAILVGGKVNGLMLRADGFGLAYFASLPGVVSKQVLVYLAGPFSTLIFGVIIAAVAWLVRKSYFISLALLVLAANLLLEGPPYLFWNAYLHVPPGDVGRVFELTNSIPLMTGLLIGAGLITVASIIFINIAFIRAIERWFGGETMLSSGKRFLAFLLIFLMQAASWFIFDWNLLAPGLNQLPNLIGVGLTALTLFALWFMPSKPLGDTIGKAGKPILIAWSTLVILVGVILVWFQPGIHW